MADDPTDVNGGEAGSAREDPVAAIHEAAAPASFSSPSFTPPGSGSVAGATPRPEVAIGAAFAGGFVVAMLLKRLGH